MYEITYGSDTPLTIDEATQAILFSLHARVLVDVDMLEKLFESV